MIGQKIIFLSTVDSTNNYVAKLLREGNIEHGTVILAEEQRAGRGQRGTEWQSEQDKNLTFSFLLKEVNLSVSDQFRLTQVVSLSLVSALKRIGVEAKIKWPNDIFVDGKKIAGVLIENAVQGNKINESITGIGLNVNQEHFSGFNATSIKNELKKFHDKKEILLIFIDEFNKTIALMGQPEMLNEAYFRYLLGYQESGKFKDVEGFFEGIISGISDSGELVINKGDSSAYYQLKEIEFIF